VQARQCVVEMPHASGQMVKVIANPVRLSGTPAEYRLPPPTLGQHTDEVLRETLGIGDPELADLRSKGII
jgi:crotonobetainyl-CoA:carnitine CoA-transferase CaiB-like acyl-CoA transferase